MRYCSYCCTEKFYNPDAKPRSKASGFMQARCWDCRRAASATASARLRSTEEGRAKNIAASTKHRSTEAGHAKANAAALAWQKRNPERKLVNHHKYHDRKRGNTELLSPEDQALTNRTIAEIRSYGLSVDHMIPVTEYGEHAHWNLNGLPSSLNSAKSNKLLFKVAPLSWLEMRQQNLPVETYELLIQDLL